LFLVIDDGVRFFAEMFGYSISGFGA